MPAGSTTNPTAPNARDDHKCSTAPCGALRPTHPQPPSAPPRHAAARTAVLRAGSRWGKFGPSREIPGAADTLAGDPGDRGDPRGSSGRGLDSCDDCACSPQCDTPSRSTRALGRKNDRWKMACHNIGKHASAAVSLVSPRPQRPGTTHSDLWTDAETDAILIPSNTSPRARHRGPGGVSSGPSSLRVHPARLQP